MKALKEQGFQLAVASASAMDIIGDYIEQLGYAQYFDRVVSSQFCAHGKPEPDVFLLAAKELGIAPEDCMVVEDSVNGMLAAQRAGMKWIGFNGSKIPADVSRAPYTFSDYRSISPEQFVQWYEKFPNIKV